MIAKILKRILLILRWIFLAVGILLMIWPLVLMIRSGAVKNWDTDLLIRSGKLFFAGLYEYVASRVLYAAALRFEGKIKEPLEAIEESELDSLVSQALFEGKKPLAKAFTSDAASIIGDDDEPEIPEDENKLSSIM